MVKRGGGGGGGGALMVCVQGRRNERKGGPANAYVSRGGVWAEPQLFFCMIWCKI